MSAEQDDDKLVGRQISLDQLHDQLRVAVGAIETGSQWRAWLDFAGRLHRYSFDNLMLIMSQRPDATAVASYRTWQSVHRQVQRGERSIKVIAPITRRAKAADNGNPPIGECDGNEEVRRTVVGYQPVSVFDISQTSGAPLPEPVNPALLVGAAPAGLWEALARDVSERGYRLLRAGSAELGTANGVTVPDRREVWVRDDVDDVQAVKTLAHELAHIVLHAADNPEADPCRGIKEVEAESVAYLALASHGIATDNYSFPYVVHWAYGIAEAEHVEMAEIVTRTGRRVMDAARTIIGVTRPAERRDPASAALSVRASLAAVKTATLREDVQVQSFAPVEREVLLGVVADSRDFFRSQIQNSWVPEYLNGRQLRGAIHTHGIGYAPKGWTALTDHLRSLGYADDHIEASGMATRARTGKLIDRFRDRMTIPLRTADGDLVAFTARSAPDADKRSPKYLNSPASSIYNKSEIIYGLSQYPTHSGYTPVICEGALDAIAIDLAAGATGNRLHGLATCGTALTDEHAARLVTAGGRDGICLAYDGDNAGRSATERAWAKLTKQGKYDVTIAELPAGMDPASLNADDPSRLATFLIDARAGAYVLVDRRIDAAHIVDNLPRKYALFHDVVDWAAELPADQRVDISIHAARRLEIHPDDAAQEVVERHSHFMTEATQTIIQHCHAITAELHDVASRAHDDRVATQSADHLARCVAPYYRGHQR